jgi:hypothetical protein
MRRTNGSVMSGRMKWLCSVSGLAMLFAIQTQAVADIEIKPPGSSTVSISHPCILGLDEQCSTTLKDLAHIPCPVDSESFATAIKPFETAGWNVTYGCNLSGKIIVTMYDAHLCDPYSGTYVKQPDGSYTLNRTTQHCAHGAELQMSYEPNPDDMFQPGSGERFWWVQQVTYGGTGCLPRNPAAPANFIDPPNQTLRFYSWPITDFKDAPYSGCCTKEGWMGDCFISQDCLLPCSWSETFNTYVGIGTLQDAADRRIKIFDGVSWGFTAECKIVPAPPAVVLCSIGLALAGWLQRRRSPG